MKAVSIAIDGPSGAGKSTLAKRLAERLGFVYVDTGAIYRTIGLRALRSGVDPKDAGAVAAMLDQVHLEIQYGEDGLQHMMLDGEDVTKDIRLPEVSRYASLVSAHPCVRDYLLEMQRSLARSHCVIMDGRDIGTVVLPNADVKIFLTATPEERARRRCLELEQRGTPQPFDQVLSDILERDKNDTERPVAPLRQAEDAVRVDTTQLDFDASLDALEKLIKEKL